MNNNTDAIWKRDEIQSPCVKLCALHPVERLCIGCFRTVDEITGWSKLTHQERSAIMAELPDREPRVKKRRGGHEARLNRG